MRRKLKRVLLITITIAISCSLINVVEHLIRGYFHCPKKEIFAFRGMGWVFTEETSEFGKPIQVNFSGERSHYVFRINGSRDGVRGKIELNGIGLLQNNDEFLGILRENEECFDASLSTENIDLFIAEDVESFILICENSVEDIFDIGESGTVLIIYPASSLDYALNVLSETIPKSVALQRRLQEIDWK